MVDLGRRAVFVILSAFNMRQLWSIHQWRCQKIDWVLLHGDDLFLENFVRELMLTANKLFVKDITTQFPPTSNYFFQLIRETTVALLNCPNFCVPLQYHNNRFSLARTHFQNGRCGTRILSGTLPRVGKWMELSLFHTGDLRIILLQPQRVRNVERFIVDAWNKL